MSPKNTCPHGKINWWKTSGTRRGTISCSTTQVDIIIVVYTQEKIIHNITGHIRQHGSAVYVGMVVVVCIQYSCQHSLFLSARLHVPQCSLHSRKSKETREVKTFSTKTRSNVGMVPCVSEEHVCLHGKTNWWKNSRNKEEYHSMLNNPGEHSVASYFKDTLDTSPSLHLATF